MKFPIDRDYERELSELEKQLSFERINHIGVGVPPLYSPVKTLN